MKRVHAPIRAYTGIVVCAVSCAGCQERGLSTVPFTRLEVGRILSCPLPPVVTPEWHTVETKVNRIQVTLPPFADLKTATGWVLAVSGADGYSFSVRAMDHPLEHFADGPNSLDGITCFRAGDSMKMRVMIGYSDHPSPGVYATGVLESHSAPVRISGYIRKRSDWPVLLAYVLSARVMRE
jgi:hypothetical protein